MDKEHGMETEMLELVIINSPTVLSHIIETIKRRRINIHFFFAFEGKTAIDDGFVRISLHADLNQMRILQAQLERQVDVISVSNSFAKTDQGCVNPK